VSWWLDELGHAGDEHLDAEYVAAYDRKAGFDPAEDVDVLKGHGLDDSTTLIDLGAGTGRFTLAVAPRCRRVIAVDVSPAMTAVLREAVDAAGGPHRPAPCPTWAGMLSASGKDPAQERVGTDPAQMGARRSLAGIS